MRKKTDKRTGFTLIELLACQPKALRRQARAAFTLIELLVVITIIGLLTAILVPAITGALKGGTKARAMSQIEALDGGIKRYFAEYGKMPVPFGDNGLDDQLVTGTAQGEVVGILIDSPERTSLDQNPKKIVFLDLDPASFGVKTIDDMEVQLALTGYPDPWGESYGILMDLNFDGIIEGPAAVGNIPAKVGVYSLGDPDKEYEITTTPFKTW